MLRTGAYLNNNSADDVSCRRGGMTFTRGFSVRHHEYTTVGWQGHIQGGKINLKMLSTKSDLFVDNIFKFIFMNENCGIMIQSPQKSPQALQLA